ncbi:MAG: DegT/DnrJ/EryC1/StrS family aminotransferase [Verrucomicrobiota bacterium]
MILVSQPDFGPTETAAAQKVLESQWVGMGPQTEKFEAALASYLGVSHVVATNSCTAALHLAMASLLDDGRNEVIVPSLTFAATIQAVLMAGYKPVFAEVEPATLNLDCEDVAELLGPQTRAILPVHFAGQPCELERLRQLAEPFGVDVVADAAHAFGSTYGGAAIGAQGTATCFSFSSNKNISSGEGGALTTGSDDLAARARELRFLGINQHTWARRNQEKPWHYAVTGPGFRYHMSDINAAIGLAQLNRLNEFARRRREIAATYDAALRDLPWTVPVQRNLAQTIPNLYVLRVTHGLRDTLHAAMRTAGIGCGVHYVPNHQQPAFRDFARPLPVTEQLAAEVISLPLHTRLSPDQVEHIVAEVSRFLKHARPARETQTRMANATA